MLSGQEDIFNSVLELVRRYDWVSIEDEQHRNKSPTVPTYE